MSLALLWCTLPSLNVANIVSIGELAATHLLRLTLPQKCFYFSLPEVYVLPRPSTIHVFQTRADPVSSISPGLALATRIAKTNQHSGELGDIHIAILVQIKEFVGAHHAWCTTHTVFCYDHPFGPEATQVIRMHRRCTWMPHSCFE